MGSVLVLTPIIGLQHCAQPQLAYTARHLHDPCPNPAIGLHCCASAWGEIPQSQECTQIARAPTAARKPRVTLALEADPGPTTMCKSATSPTTSQVLAARLHS